MTRLLEQVLAQVSKLPPDQQDALASRWLDDSDALLAVAFFWCIPIVQFTVCDARPYALGLLALSSAWLSALRS